MSKLIGSVPLALAAGTMSLLQSASWRSQPMAVMYNLVFLFSSSLFLYLSLSLPVFGFSLSLRGTQICCLFPSVFYIVLLFGSHSQSKAL